MLALAGECKPRDSQVGATDWLRILSRICSIALISLKRIVEALSRLEHGFESRWGHHFDFVEVFCERFPSRVGGDGNP